MKRSEMVNLIQDVINCNYDYDPDIGWYVDCDTVLKEIEAVGMLPPLIHEEIKPKSVSMTEVLRIHAQWEPELEFHPDGVKEIK